MSDNFKRWKFGPFASGASSGTGVHWKVLGLTHTWLPPSPYWPANKYEFRLFGLLAVEWSKMGFQWAVGSVSLKFSPAHWRYGEREKARQNRASRRRFMKALEQSRS